ncbi:MAG TPA: DNA-directed RNA polymerase subunit beta, partial [Phycisphaerae bacterium]|nr:DNA-directed RNA polymerase subunit beta [Phycisphaerae bacterium]
MLKRDSVRNFCKVGDFAPLPNLIDLQTASYERFLQADIEPSKRKNEGLEALLREVFPMISYDETMRLDYLDYELGEPRFKPQECRDLRLTYGLPLRIRCRLVCKDPKIDIEESIYVGEIPIMLGGGEFIINGAERVIVSQLHRSPGVDFTVELQESDRPLHGARIIPERGSWIELSVTKKDSITMRIDQSSKIPATMFMRSLDERYGATQAIIREFYAVEKVAAEKLTARTYLVEGYVDPETGEELVPAGGQVGDAMNQIVASAKKKIEIIAGTPDPLILNTLSEDPSTDYESALLRIYARLRPGNPPQVEKAKALFQEKFFDENRYRLGKVGRFRINRKFGQDVPESVMSLRVEDFVHTMSYMLKLRGGQGVIDDIDHLGNRRLRTIDELAADEMRKGFLKLRRTVQERMSLKDPSEITKIAEIVNSKSISSSIEFFFGRGELSQVVDQQNPLAQLTHERRLSALGPGGLNRKRAGFEVRDVHISHYGRICPIETPEGNNIGLISSMGIYAGVDDYGFLTTPYLAVDNRKVLGEVVNLRADEEMMTTLAPPEVLLNANRRGETTYLPEGRVLARVDGELSTAEAKNVKYIDISPKQTVGISASLIPFLEHDDANRALMGSNMQRQAVPLLRTDPPIVATGMEKAIAENTSFSIKARKAGKVTYADAERIIIDGSEEYELRKFEKLNERACQNQKTIVKVGERVKKGQIIADGSATYHGELALGRNVLVAFMPFDGYNFEDAILLSEKLVREDVFTSVHLEDYEVEIRETKLGREEFTRDIPNVSEKSLRYLDANGVVQVGTRVKPGDILVGKVSPKSKTELSPEEKLLHAIFGRAGEDVKNDSLELPAGEEGVVVSTKHFSRRGPHMTEEQKKQLKKDMKDYEDKMNERMAKIFREMCGEINEVAGQAMIDPTTRQKVGQSENLAVILEQIETFNAKWIKGEKEKGEEVYNRYWQRIKDIEKEKQRKLAHMKRGDDLPSGVLEMVKVTVATKRKLGVGDKMAGRHGNKGVIARIMPEADMPFLEDGTPVEILLNPLGVPGRMNLGQILETHLGWAAAVLGFQAVTPIFDGATEGEIFKAIDEANQHVRERREMLDVVQTA